DEAEDARRVMGHAAEARLEPGQAAKRAGDADRAAAIRAERQRTDAGGERGGGAGARPAGRVGKAPGFAGDAGERTVAQRLPAEFRHGRLAEQHGAMLAQPRHRRTILAPVLIAADERRAAQGRPALRKKKILDGYRYAVEQAPGLAPCPAGFGRPRLGKRA